MFQCTSIVKARSNSDFLKVVSTNFVYLNGEEVPSHQYSVTQYERNLDDGNAPGKDGHARTWMAYALESFDAIRLTRRRNKSRHDGYPGCFHQLRDQPNESHPH